MSKIQHLKRLEEESAKTQALIDQLRKDLEGVGQIVETVRAQAAERGVDLLEICYALVPSLEKTSKKGASSTSSEQGTRQKRRLKRYTNPHNGEVIETKGGNHKGLQEWKKEHGSETVEEWCQYIEE